MKTKPIDHDLSTERRQDSYQFYQMNPRFAAHLMKVADALEAKEPLAWQPAGTIPIATLLNPKNTK